MKKNILLSRLAYFLIAVILINFFLHYIYRFNFAIEFFWYCNAATIVLILGILFDKKGLVSAVFITAIAAQFRWIVDYILVPIGYRSGRTAWLFSEGLFIFTISTILHASLIPISFYATYKIGFSKKSLLYGFIIFILLMFPLTYFFTPIDENINCVFYPCDLNLDETPEEIYSNPDYISINYLIKVMLFWSFIIVISYFISLNFFKIISAPPKDRKRIMNLFLRRNKN